MTMFNITEDNNNISFGKPVEHIDIDNGAVEQWLPCPRFRWSSAPATGPPIG